MSSHNYIFVGEDEVNHKFACKRCGRELWFNKPEIGSPNAIVLDEPIEINGVMTSVMVHPDYDIAGTNNPTDGCL